MAIQTLEYLKTKFETGDVPTQQDFWDWLETMFHLASNASGDYVPLGGTSQITGNLLANLTSWILAIGDGSKAQILISDSMIRIQKASPNKLAQVIVENDNGSLNNIALQIIDFTTSQTKTFSISATNGVKIGNDVLKYDEDRSTIIESTNYSVPNKEWVLGKIGNGIPKSGANDISGDLIAGATNDFTIGLDLLLAFLNFYKSGSSTGGNWTITSPNSDHYTKILLSANNAGSSQLLLQAGNGSAVRNIVIIEDNPFEIVGADIRYNGDYSGSYTNRSLVDKAYADSVARKFAINIEYTNGALQATEYFKTAATLTFNKRESTIATLQYSTNGGSSFASITAGAISLAIAADTFVIFRITYVSPTITSRGTIYIEGE